MVDHLEIRLLHPLAHIPRREGAFYDLFAFCLSPSDHPFKAMIPPHYTVSIHTKIALLPPLGFIPMIVSRTGLASRSVWLAVSPLFPPPDTEIVLPLHNGGSTPVYVEHEMHIAKLALLELAAFPLRIIP